MPLRLLLCHERDGRAGPCHERDRRTEFLDIKDTNWPSCHVRVGKRIVKHHNSTKQAAMTLLCEQLAQPCATVVNQPHSMRRSCGISSFGWEQLEISPVTLTWQRYR